MFDRYFLQKYRRHAARAFLSCLVIIAILSLVPGQHRPHTSMAGRMEHAVAYAGTGVFMMFGFLTARSRVRGYVGVVFLAFAFEVLQTWIPGRSSNILDALASSAGLTAGVAAGWLLTMWMGERNVSAA
jgi:VanZ family protein